MQLKRFAGFGIDTGLLLQKPAPGHPLAGQTSGHAFPGGMSFEAWIERPAAVFGFRLCLIKELVLFAIRAVLVFKVLFRKQPINGAGFFHGAGADVAEHEPGSAPTKFDAVDVAPSSPLRPRRKPEQPESNEAPEAPTRGNPTKREPGEEKKSRGGRPERARGT